MDLFLLLISFILSIGLTRSSTSNRHTWEPRKPPSADWESLIFWISNGIGGLGQACREHSDFYCLEGYTTQPFNLSLPSGAEVDASGSNSCPGVAAGYDPAACKAWFSVLVQEKWASINMIDIRDPTDCCEAQTEKYMVNGLRNRGMTPDEYMHKLTDYDNEQDKPLNFLSAMYIPWLCQNIILDVGFGPGPLRRDHHPNIVEGYPYIIAGKEFPDVGIPHIRTKYINFENPGSELTFDWFKHNIMCEDHPWICKGSKNGKKTGLSSGNKKSRRKNERN